MDEKEKLKAALDQIHAEESLKTSARKYLYEKVYFKEKRRRSLLRNFAAATCCSLVVLAAAGAWLFFTPTAYISVDVNPSMELGINRFDRIISVTGYNEDGRALAQELHIKYMDYTEGLETLMEDQNMEVYMTDNADIVLTVAGESSTQSSEILENVESCMADHENVSCHSGNSEEIHHAHDAGLSFGKYQAWQILQELNPDITLEEVQGMTMAEIRGLIEEYSREESGDEGQTSEAEDPEGSQGQGQGNGNGNGNSRQSGNEASQNIQEESSGDHLEETWEHGHHGSGHQEHRGDD